MDRNVEIANTILSQIPGRTKVELGMKQLLAIDNGLRFSTTNLKGTKVEITLNAMDTYDVESFKVRGIDKVAVKQTNGVYFDQLADVLHGIVDANWGVRSL